MASTPIWDSFAGMSANVGGVAGSLTTGTTIPTYTGSTAYTFASSGSVTGSYGGTYGEIAAKKIELDGQDLGEVISSINDRLAILVPDLEKLEKYAALKEIYLQYKLLEKLCREDDTDE